jgi:type VI secretion system secreted protein Hcp
MAVDAFLSLVPKPGAKAVAGESQDKTYGKTAFEIKDFEIGVENPTTIGSATGGAGAGKVKFNEFQVKKNLDTASPVLFQNCAAGQHYDHAILYCRKAGTSPTGSGKAYLTFVFTTVFTTKVEWSGPGDEGPEETITFVYGTMQVKYQVQQKDGTLGPATVGEWSQVTNTQSVPNVPT